MLRNVGSVMSNLQVGEGGMGWLLQITGFLGCRMRGGGRK